MRQALTRQQSLDAISVKHRSASYVNNLEKITLPKRLQSEILGFDTRALAEIIVARKAIESVTVALTAKIESKPGH